MYVGLDVHKRVCYGTMMDEEGRVVKQDQFSNDPEGLKEFMDGVDEAMVAMEAGYCWQPLYDDLEEAGYDVRLAHPQKVKAIAEAKVKPIKSTRRPWPTCFGRGCCPSHMCRPGTSGSSGTGSGGGRSSSG